MILNNLILSFFFLVSMSFAYTFHSEPQEPLIRPPLSQPPPSRRIVLRSSSQPVSGSYPLYDLLSISTESGSVSVAVTPQSASEEDPSQPASLELKSHSGSVHVTLSEAFGEHYIRSDDASSEPPPPYQSIPEAADYDNNAKYDIKASQKNIPEQIYKDGSGNTAIKSGVPTRDYTTSVSTQSGSISGTFPLGSHTALESRSGSLGGIELIVMPIKTSGSRRLKTVSRDGMQSVRIVDDDFWSVTKEAWWEGMVSRHESHSGSINVEYPDSWEGTIEVESESGSVSVTGRGVEIIREEKGRVVARKGKEGGGKVVVRARSGSVDLRFG